MSSLDLLFAARPESERMHQAALKVLLERTPLVSKLTDSALVAREVVWEPHRGAYDLLVRCNDGRDVYVELKVDSVLGHGQIREQLSHSAMTPDNSLIYLLMGTSGISRGARWGQWKYILGDIKQPRIFDGDTLIDVIRSSISAETPAEVRDIAESYIKLIESLTLRTRRFAGKQIGEFEYHDYLGYFDALRQQIDFTSGSTVEYVPNQAGGFVCCAWEGIPTSEGGLYLQFEEEVLCLKLWVDDMERSQRPQARSAAFQAATAAATKFPGLGFEPTKARYGESMTLARLTKVELHPDPRDEKLTSHLAEAHAFVKATAAGLGPAKP